MLIRLLALPFFLFWIALLIRGAVNGNTLELPRADEQALVLRHVFIAELQGWHYVSEHYLITAPRLEEVHRVAPRLEHLFCVWQLLLAEHFEAEHFGERENKPELLHRVVIFRNQQEYNRELLPIEPSIARTNGYYSAPRKTAYFYSTEAKILFHEGTHQILAERLFHENIPAFRNNFWVVEGIAAFMETLKIEENSYKIGDILADKLFAAKVYQFERNYNMPIQRLTAMSAADIQSKSNAEIQRIYSQSATLVHWLMFAEEGRYRKHLFELLRQTYLGTAGPDTLSTLTGLSYEELDKRYVEFLETIPD